MATILHLALVLFMAIPFPYFMTAGANIFTVPKLRDSGAVLGQISFISGMVCVLVMGLFYGLLLPAAVCGAIFGLLVPAALCGCVLALCSVVLYEWTRRTVIDRNFYIALAGEVPPAVCEVGPYQYIRHPFYLSYMLAFLGVAIAFPSLIVSGVCVLNVGLFVYMAIDDERVLRQSPLAADYDRYKMRVGMFLPTFGAKQSPTK
jgi:protein-S-isoprenylcysteine O-methyltransferase Ste14